MKKFIFSSVLVASLASFAFGSFPGNGKIIIKSPSYLAQKELEKQNQPPKTHRQIYREAFCRWYGC